MKKSFCLLSICLAFVLGCGAAGKKTSEGAKVNSFISVSMDEGLRLMSEEKDFVLLDVRTPAEYKDGHIPGALQLTNETFTEEDALKIIPDRSRKIFCYCRSGRRSKEASQKLVDFGYISVIEIGGIMSYKGELEK